MGHGLSQVSGANHRWDTLCLSLNGLLRQSLSRETAESLKGGDALREGGAGKSGPVALAVGSLPLCVLSAVGLLSYYGKRIKWPQIRDLLEGGNYFQLFVEISLHRRNHSITLSISPTHPATAQKKIRKNPHDKSNLLSCLPRKIRERTEIPQRARHLQRPTRHDRQI